MDNLNVALSDSRCDLGENGKVLAELVSNFSNARFMDLGVRHGHSSMIMSIDAKENNNQVCGCDIDFRSFNSFGSNYVNDNYTCYLYDTVSLGKQWDEDPFDIIFVDTEHTREQVLAELYFWINHIKEGGYFIFHDSHWLQPGPVYGGVQYERVDVAITDFFGLPTSVREMTTYEDDYISLKHCSPSNGMTFIQLKSLENNEKFKQNVEWEKVFEHRNRMVEFMLNPNNPDSWSKHWGLDYKNISFEPLITME